jgi:hypothetical protein
MGSWLPTMNKTGAATRAKALPARSGLPPRDTTARTLPGRSAAPIRAAAAPVLAPKYPKPNWLNRAWRPTQSVIATSLRARRPISKRNSAVCMSIASSCPVSRSMRMVAISPSFSTSATWRFLGLRLLLPLPCAKTTNPVARSGIAISAARLIEPRRICVTIRSISGVVVRIRQTVQPACQFGFSGAPLRFNLEITAIRSATEAIIADLAPDSTQPLVRARGLRIAICALHFGLTT